MKPPDAESAAPVLLDEARLMEFAGALAHLKTITRLRTLLFLHLSGECSPGAVIDHLQVCGTVVTQAVEYLEAEGLAVRRFGKEDRRRVFITTTDKAKELLAGFFGQGRGDSAADGDGGEAITNE